MTRRYAETTKVPVAQTKAEIEGMLLKIGADRIGMMETRSGEAYVVFETEAAMYKLSAPALDPNAKNLDQERRRVWRAMGLLVKAKMTAITEGISTVEREFLADAVMPDGSTMIEHAPRLIEQATSEHGPPRLMLTGPGGA